MSQTAADPQLELAGPRSVARRAGPWIMGVLVLLAVVVVVLHFGELRRFADVTHQARPAWLAAAVALQAATYVCSAAVWYLALRRGGSAQRLRSLIPLGLVKLFTDQALPTGGLSGAVAVATGLQHRGVPLRTAMATLLVSLVSYYTAYLLAVIAAVLLLWLHHAVNPAIIWIALVFALVAVGTPAAVLWLRRLGSQPLVRKLKRFSGWAALLRAIDEAPMDLVRDPWLLAGTTLCQLGVYLLDSATLWVMLKAVGQDVSLLVAVPSFVMGSVVATLGPIPLGLGTFEATCIGLLKVLGVPLEAGLAATLLWRGFTFWLPMLPGVLLARREIRRGNRPPANTRG